MTYEQVAKVLFLDDSTARAWRRAYEDAGVESIYSLDIRGGAGLLSPEAIADPPAWNRARAVAIYDEGPARALTHRLKYHDRMEVAEVLPTSTTDIAQFVKERFEFDYTRSGLIKLMDRIGFALRHMTGGA